MNKKLLSALIMVLGLITIISLHSVYSSIPWQNQGQNDTYVDFGTGVKLYAEATPEGWKKVVDFSIAESCSTVDDVTTNMTSWSDGCCLFVADSGEDIIAVYDTSGNNVKNITVASGVGSYTGIWTNASGQPVTDFWLVDDTTRYLYHLAADGSLSPDPTGNFTIHPNSAGAQGVTSNISSGVPSVFYILDRLADNIQEWTADGTNTRNFTLPAGIPDGTGITTNDTGVTPTYFVIPDLTNDEVYVVDTAGNIIEQFDTAGVGATQPRGATVLKGAGKISEVTVVCTDTDKLYRFYRYGLGFAILSTNETGAWENKSAYGSPKDMGDAVVATWSNFTWLNSSLDCSKVIGWKIYYNDSTGAENVTSIKTFYYIPYVNDTSYALSKITSATCESKHNITLTFDDTPAGRVSVIMPFVYFDSTAECAYEGSEGTRVTIYNESEYCWIRLNHSSLSSGDTIKIYSTKSLRVEPPPNLPAALTAAAVGLIIVIYFIVSKEEES